jgi:undecaprenyl-phosphate 4-deoxy-4-formamido-L-arabinose transferase
MTPPRARGEYIINLDADMQNPPEEIPKLIEKIKEGHDVVNSYRMDRQDSVFRNSISKFANKVRYMISGIEVRDMGCMLRAYHKDIVKQITQSQEASTFIPLLAQMYAANPAEVGVKHAAREAGESNYNLYKLLRYNFDMMTSVSIVPLQLFTIVGMIVSALSGLLVVYMVLRRIFIGPEAEGLFTLFAIAFLLMGVIITGLGIVGEYVGRIYQTVRGRTRYNIKTIHEDI